EPLEFRIRMNLSAVTTRKLSRATGAEQPPDSCGVLIPGTTPPRGPGFYGALSQTCKQKSRIRAPPDLHGCAGKVPGSPIAAGRPGLPGVEGQLQVVHAPQLVVHLQQGLNDCPDLRGHAVDFLVGDALQLALELLVEVQKSSKPADCREAAVDI